MQGLFITGTSTDVGKTVIACAIAQQLVKAGFQVIPRKPIETGCTYNNNVLVAQDALALKLASHYSSELDNVCRYRFKPAISPAKAIELAHQKINLALLVDACQPCDRDNSLNNFLLVEGAGGFYSPLTKDGLNADLATILKLPVLLVANNELGVINHVLLSAKAIKQHGLLLLAVVLNTTQDKTSKAEDYAQMDNATQLKNYLDCPVFTCPYSKNKAVKLAPALIDMIT